MHWTSTDRKKFKKTGYTKTRAFYVSSLYLVCARTKFFIFHHYNFVKFSMETWNLDILSVEGTIDTFGNSSIPKKEKFCYSQIEQFVKNLSELKISFWFRIIKFLYHKGQVNLRSQHLVMPEVSYKEFVTSRQD